MLEHPHAPSRRDAHQQQEDDHRHAPAEIGFAPALEHGDQSNAEQEHGAAAEQFLPHNSLADHTLSARQTRGKGGSSRAWVIASRRVNK